MLSPAATVARTASSLGLAVVLAALGCAGGSGIRPEQLVEIPMPEGMGRPSPQAPPVEQYDVVVANQRVRGVRDEGLDRGIVQAKRALERFSRDAGVRVIDRSLQNVGAVNDEEALNEILHSGPGIEGADVALITSYSTYRYSKEWKKPRRMPWDDDEEYLAKTGRCRHLAEVELDVKLYALGSNDRLMHVYALENHAEGETEDLTGSCLLTRKAREDLFEKAVDEALDCIRFPIQNLLAPRGRLTEHRRHPEKERHYYRTTLGTIHGAQSGGRVQVLRAEPDEGPPPATAVDERLRPLARGEFVGFAAMDSSWIEVDHEALTEPLFEGDRVRPVFDEGGWSAALSRSRCDEILEGR